MITRAKLFDRHCKIRNRTKLEVRKELNVTPMTFWRWDNGKSEPSEESKLKIHLATNGDLTPMMITLYYAAIKNAKQKGTP